MTVIVSAALILSPFPAAELGLIVGQLAQVLMGLLSIGFALYIAANRAFPLPFRRAWGLLGLGLVSAALGEAFGAYSLLVNGAIPSLSWTDAFYLLAYPLALAGILLLPYAPTRREQRLLLIIDMSIVVLVCAVFMWYFVVAHLVDVGIKSLPGVIAIAYPLGDLLILVGLVSLVQRDVQGLERTVLLSVCASTLLLILGDALNAILVAHPADRSIGLWRLDAVLFLVARFGFLVGALWQATGTRSTPDQGASFSPLLRANSVYLAVLSAIGLALVSMFSFSGSNLRLHGTIAGTFAITILVLLRQYSVLRENLRLSREVERLAITDALTGLFNRRYFDEALAREIARAQRYHTQLAVLLIDLDNFKTYNDRYGHVAGDRLLKDCAHLIRSQLRSVDLVARYGGDEFVAILPETNVEMCHVAAERLREAAQAKLAPKAGTTLSIGCAGFQPDMTAATLLELADQAMYREKHPRVTR